MSRRRRPTPPNARHIAYRVLRRVEGEGAYAALALRAAFSDAGDGSGGGLSGPDKRLATELVYGVLRHRPRLDRALKAMTERGLRKQSPTVVAVLRVAAYEILFLDRVPARASVHSAVAAVRQIAGPRLGGFVNGVLRRLARDGEPPLPEVERDVRRHVEVACSLPRWIVDVLADAVGEGELVRAAEAIQRPAPLSLRVNRTRSSIAAVRARLALERPDAEVHASPWLPAALLVSGIGDPESVPSFAQGLWTVQDVAAQLVGHVLEPEPGWRVLDACAGVGGKATHMRELVARRDGGGPTRDNGGDGGGDGGGVRIDAADVSTRKLGLLAAHAERLGLDGIHCHAVDLLDAADIARAGLDVAFDGVVLDAPCTGLGVLRRHPEARYRVVAADVERLAALQREMLDMVAMRVKPGGVLVYSVCTFTEAEGPRQIEAFLQRHPAFSLDGPRSGGGCAAAGTEAESATASSGQEVNWEQLRQAGANTDDDTDDDTGAETGRWRIWPHVHNGDGFYIARLRRIASAD